MNPGSVSILGGMPRIRGKLTLLLLVGLAGAALVAPAAADARFKAGISDQHPETFSNVAFQRLHVGYARLVVPWDVRKVRIDRRITASWLAGAQASKIRPLISFTHSRVHPRKLPSPGLFKREFKAFRKTYPWIRDYSPWNEANHKSQPTFRKPKVAARYYNVVRANCRSCTIVALDVLDQPDMVWYVKAFKRSARGKKDIWGLHNYGDTNYRRNRATRALLRNTRGQIWLTETGGLVRFARGWPYNIRRAAKATKYMFHLAASNRRITRLYIYCYWGEPRGARFDAGLVGPTGKPRPAYYVVKRKLR
jgi:hypothetical protein